MTLYLNEREVTQLITMPEAMDAVEAAFASASPGSAAEAENQPRGRFFLPHGVMHTMAAALPAQKVMGTKTYTSFGHETRFWVMLYSSENGDLLALIEADKLGQMRTGAATGVAARYLARQDVENVALFGSGWQSEAQVEALLTARPKLREFHVYSRNSFNRDKFCKKMMARFGIRFHSAGSAEEAARNAEVFVCSTTAREPFLEASWISPGDFIAGVGANRFTARELGEEVIASADLVVVDDIAQAKVESSELIYAYERRKWSWAKAVPLADVVTGKVGRRAPQEITLFKSLGVALEDIAVARLVYEKAKDQGIGREMA